jgi:pimeloyl-ACP methyl ester carboxylesterase
MSCFGPEFTYVTWDYRGLFGSDKLVQPRGLAIHEHAKDALEVLRAAGFEKADVMIGHSLGTAVTLEFVLLFPECVKALVLMNGFHGHVFSTAFQPLVRIPFMGDFISSLTEMLISNQWMLRRAGGQKYSLGSSAISYFTRVFGSSWLKEALGEEYLLDFMERYMAVLTSEDLECSLRLFQELDAHSVYHLLPTITQPTLVISGFWDVLTPALQSLEISRRVPHSVHYCDPLSTHATPLESPERCLGVICSFFDDNGIASVASSKRAKSE